MRDFIIKIIVKLGLYKKIADLATRLYFKRQKKLMQRYGLEMLQKADETFSKTGVRAFLTFGALLGAYRDKGFISYDPDIDLGVLAEEIPNNIHELMQAAGFQLIKQIYIKENNQIAEETYEYKKLRLDIFYYYAKDEDLYCLIQRRHEYKDWKEANAADGFPCDYSFVPKTDFERRQFYHLQVYMPIDTDGWLRAIYSDSYMTPIKNWEASGYKTRIEHSNLRSYRKFF